METITVLIPTNKSPNTLGDRTLRQLKNILNELKKKYELKIYWISFYPEKTSKIELENSKILDFHDYENALEILDIVKPDIILISGWIEFSTSLFSFLGKIKKIPVVSVFSMEPYVIRKWTKKIMFKKRTRLLLSNRMLEPSVKRNSSRFRVLRFMMEQYMFLLKSIYKIKISKLKKLNFIFTLSYALLTENLPSPSLMKGELNLCFVQEMVELLIFAGYKKSDLALVGNPDFDNIYSKIQNFKPRNPNNSDKIRLLLCTTSWHEAGMGKKSEEDNLILSTIKEIHKNSDFIIDIKIHPSRDSKKEYQDLLSKNNLKVNLYQEESLIDLLGQYDVLITYAVSSVFIWGIVMKIPILFVQYSTKDPEPFGHDEKVTLICKNIDLLIMKIKEARSKKVSKIDYEKFVEKYMGIFDGKSSERAANAILKLVSK